MNYNSHRKVKNQSRKLEATLSLLQTMNILRAECPWDRKQTMKSLRNLTVEEVYELTDAIDQNDEENIMEELGDVLLHIVFYAKIGEEKEAFDWADVAENLIDKLERRHPHIYGDVVVKNEDDVKRNWEQIKMDEKKSGGSEKQKSVLSGVPSGLPAMIKALRMQEKTAKVGFEWDDKSQVKDKLNEEIDEFFEVIEEKQSNKKELEEEFGDVMFSLINLARYYDIDPETALAKTNLKFKSRFEYIEKHAPKDLTEMSLNEMDKLWEEAKGS